VNEDGRYEAVMTVTATYVIPVYADSLEEAHRIADNWSFFDDEYITSEAVDIEEVYQVVDV
jgi:hypothetical protein